MKGEDFNQVVEKRILQIRRVLQAKACEYATDDDRMHNFKVAARLEQNEQSQEQALWGMLKKHLVSVIDIVEMTGRGICPAPELVDEKIGDSINYLVLLEAMLVERWKGCGKPVEFQP